MATALQTLPARPQGLAVLISDFDTEQIFGALKFIPALFKYSLHILSNDNNAFPGTNGVLSLGRKVEAL
jgi:hypothetical protein